MTERIDNNIVESFWNKYCEADMLDKEKVLEPVMKNILGSLEIEDEEIRKTCLQNLIMSYFDDLIDYMRNYEDA